MSWLLAEIQTEDQPPGLGIRDDLGAGHPLLGQRMPDLDLVTEGGPLRVFTLIHEARPLLTNLGSPGASTSARGRTASGRPRRSIRGRWEQPAIGTAFS